MAVEFPILLIRQAAAAGQVSRYATPERIEFVPELPRTSVGKLDKKAMRLRLQP